jgi:hypothetical protein
VYDLLADMNVLAINERSVHCVYGPSSVSKV